MAKRDKLYTVNRWNKPLFEEGQRKKRLYGDGGNPIYGLKLNQGGMWNSYGVLPTGFNSNPDILPLAKQNTENPGVVNWFQHTGKPWYGTSNTTITPDFDAYSEIRNNNSEESAAKPKENVTKPKSGILNTVNSIIESAP